MSIQLFNDDCLKVLKNIPDNSIDLICCDPPYRVISGGKPHKKGQPSGMLSKNDGKIFEHNDIKPEMWIPEAYRVLKEGSQCYIMTNTLNMERCLRICRETGFGLHNILVWLKNNTVTNRWYMKNCEYVLFLRKGEAKSINNKGSQTVHQFNNIIGNKRHPTEKPVELIKYYIENSSNVGDTVLDMFMGVGSTGEAAKELGRNFIGIEIDKKYYTIAEEKLLK
jgi:site-specific DNA-methyltransferase (adenine-specific)